MLSRLKLFGRKVPRITHYLAEHQIQKNISYPIKFLYLITKRILRKDKKNDQGVKKLHGRKKKQAEAEVAPSSSSVKVTLS